MSRGSLVFLALKGALLAAIPILALPEDGPQIYALAVLILAMPAALMLRKRWG